MPNRDKAFEVSNDGLIVDGGHHLSSGVGVPSHSGKKGDRYIDTNTSIAWRLDADGSSWVEDTSSGGHIIQEDGVSLPQREKLDFKSGFDLVDNAGADATEVNLDLSEVLSSAAYGVLKFNGPPTFVDLDADVWKKVDIYDVEVESGGTLVDADSTLNRIVIGADGAGAYVIGFNLDFVSSTNGTLTATLYINGVRENECTVSNVGSNGQRDNISATCLHNLNAGDYAEVWIRSSASNQDPTFNYGVFYCAKISGGSVGPQGEQGIQGPIGNTGPQGPQGIQGPAGSGSSVSLEEGGVLVTNTPHTNIDFNGTDFNVTDNGDGSATVELAGSGQTVDLAFTDKTNSYAVVTSQTYLTFARYLFDGSATFSPTTMEAIALATSGTGFVRVYDVTNAQVIAESAGFTNTGFAAINLGAISNLSAGQAIWELQMKNSNNNVDTWCSGLKIKG